MRKTGLFLLLFGIWSGCDKVAEPPLTEQDAPEAVVQAIAGRFDGVSDLTLTTLQSNMWYAADFKSQMVHYKAVLRPEGTFKNLDTEIPVASLPGTAKVYVDTYFPVNSIGFLYQNTDPATAQDIGYFTQITDSTGKYLLSFDALGAHISTVKEPTTDWWHCTMKDFDDLPANIRSVLQTAHPFSSFHHAALFSDAHQLTTWNVAVRDSNFINIYELDAAANILEHHTEDLVDMEHQQPTILDLLDVSALPTVIADFLDNQFSGWEYQRGLLLLDSMNSPIGFLVHVKRNQNQYYVRFDATGIFKGANKA